MLLRFHCGPWFIGRRCGRILLCDGPVFIMAIDPFEPGRHSSKRNGCPPHSLVAMRSLVGCLPAETRRDVVQKLLCYDGFAVLQPSGSSLLSHSWTNEKAFWSSISG